VDTEDSRDDWGSLLGKPTRQSRDATNPPHRRAREGGHPATYADDHRNNNQRDRNPTSHLTVRRQHPSPSPRCLESRASGRTRPVRGPAWTAGRLRRGMDAESKTPARTPGSAAAPAI